MFVQQQQLAWFFTVRSPTRTESCDRKPDTGPLPYSMLNTVPFATYDDDWSELYLTCEPQLEHCDDGIHRFDDPVSKITLNCWLLDPTPMACSSSNSNSNSKNSNNAISQVS